MPGNPARDFEVREAIRQVVEASRELLDTDERPVRRGQHPKQHGCVRARFLVERNLPETCRKGLFQEQKVYDAWIRFSNGRQRDDRQPDAHGMAVKLMDVTGEKALPSERNGTTQDFVMVDHPTFFLRGAVEYARFSEILEKAEGKVPSSLFRCLGLFSSGRLRSLGTLLLLSLAQGRFPIFVRLIKFASNRIVNPLSTRYWSTTPYRFGDTSMKFSAVPAEFPAGPRPEGPVDHSYEALADFLGSVVRAQTVSSPPKPASPDYLREAMSRRLSVEGAVFLFQVQLYHGEATTPINDPTVEWPEDAAPFRTVGKIWVPKQTFDTSARMAFGESLSFAPWHALHAHEPLGEINEVRKDVYASLSSFRHRLNGLDMREPTARDPSPDDLPPCWGNDSSAFCHVLEAELDLIEARRRQVEIGFGRAHDAQQEPRPVAAALDRAQLTTDQAPDAAVDRDQVAASCDSDSLTRRARLRAAQLHTMGLALSGSGLRSVSFAIGFIQGLASVSLVRHIDYLSAVSDGGHAAAWLAAWIKRDSGGLENVERQLAPRRIDQARAARQYLSSGEVVDEEPEALRCLRFAASPTEGGGSLVPTDDWFKLVSHSRNVIIRLLVLMLFLFLTVVGVRLLVASYGVIGRLGEVDRLAAEFDSRLGGPTFALGAGTLVIMVLVGVAALAAGLGALVESVPDGRRLRSQAHEEPAASDAVAVVDRRIVKRLLVASVLLSLSVPLIWRSLTERVENVSFGTDLGTVISVRTLVDAVRPHLTALSWLNFLAHALLLGTLLARWTSRRLASVEPVRRKKFVRASFAAGASAGVLIALLEGLCSRLMEHERFDLVATFVPALVLLTVVAAMIVQQALAGGAASAGERAWSTAVGGVLTTRAICWMGAVATILYLPGLIYAAIPVVRLALAAAWIGAGALGVVLGRDILHRRSTAVSGWLKWLASISAALFFTGLLGFSALLVSLMVNMPSLTAPGGEDSRPFAYYLQGMHGTSALPLAGMAIALAILYTLARRLIEISLFSRDALDAALLARSYLGASRSNFSWAVRWSQPRDQRAEAGAPSLAVPGRERALAPRDPDRLTGLDSADDFDLRGLCIGEKSEQDTTYWGPQILFNTTWSHASRAAAAGNDSRELESFVLSPLYCGCRSTGYARTPDSKPTGNAAANLTVGRAMAVSGASQSAQPPDSLAALLTLLDARPGSWIEKPKPDGWTAASPHFGDLPVSAATGLAAEVKEFLYLTGGEEFERLGVYELIRRRCRSIIAVDGSGATAPDAGLATLIRRCRSDFGIRIEINNVPIRGADTDRHGGALTFIGRIHYGDVDEGAAPGVLVYVSSAMKGSALPETPEAAHDDDRSAHGVSRLAQEADEKPLEDCRWMGQKAARLIFGCVAAPPFENRHDLARQSSVDFAPRLFSAVVEHWTEAAKARLES
jgi:hypothetical protein